MDTMPPGRSGGGSSPAQPHNDLRAVLDLLPHPLLLIEPGTGRVLFSNRPARGLPIDPAGGPVAVPVTDAGGRPVPAGDRPHERAARGEALRGEEFTWHPPGGEVTFRVFSGEVPAAPGRPPAVALSLVDVTDLRRALRARDELFSVATHELKDPLFSLQLAVRMLGRAAHQLGEVPAAVRQHLEVSERQADRVLRLVENLLDVSRAMNSRLRLDVEAVDLCDLAREVVARHRGVAEAAGVRLEAEACEPVVAYLDRLKVDQVLTNLVTNAVKYGAGRPVAVRVRGDGEAAVLEVEDQGEGIAPADHERVFRRFERASAGHRKESLGLGLYIVRSLVEAHGGTVALRSEPGRGSTFTVVVPRLRLGRPEAGGGAPGGPGEG